MIILKTSIEPIALYVNAIDFSCIITFIALYFFFCSKLCYKLLCFSAYNVQFLCNKIDRNLLVRVSKISQNASKDIEAKITIFLYKTFYNFLSVSLKLLSYLCCVEKRRYSLFQLIPSYL